MCLTACLTIEESYTFHANGSGSLVFQVRLEDWDAIQHQAEWEGTSVQLNSLSFEAVALQLRTLEGIGEVVVLDQPQQLHWGVSFSFAHLLALNQALNLLLIDDPHQHWHTFFVQNGNRITRTHKMDNLKIGKTLLEHPDYRDKVEETLQSMHYKLLYAFPSPVKVVYSEQSLTLDAKKTNHLELEANFLDLSRRPDLLDTSVILK